MPRRRPETMDEPVDGPRPVTPTEKVKGLALTEYSANPSPPATPGHTKTVKHELPEQFLLPDGQPDVRGLGLVFYGRKALTFEFSTFD